MPPRRRIYPVVVVAVQERDTYIAELEAKLEKAASMVHEANQSKDALHAELQDARAARTRADSKLDEHKSLVLSAEASADAGKAELLKQLQIMQALTICPTLTLTKPGTDLAGTARGGAGCTRIAAQRAS